MKVPMSYEGSTPKGCFLFHCSHDHTKWCFFYNGVGFLPNATHFVHGRPVCHRPRYINGTAVAGKNYTDNMDLCGNADYEVVNTQARCREVASCHSHCECGEAQSGWD